MNQPVHGNHISIIFPFGNTGSQIFRLSIGLICKVVGITSLWA